MLNAFIFTKLALFVSISSACFAATNGVVKVNKVCYCQYDYCNYFTKVLEKTKKLNSFYTFQQAEDGVREYLGEERYDYMKQINPGLISDLILRFRFGVELREWNPKREPPFEVLESIVMTFKEGDQKIAVAAFVHDFEQGLINPLRIDLPVDRSQQNFFILKNTGKFLVMNSWDQMRKRNQFDND